MNKRIAYTVLGIIALVITLYFVSQVMRSCEPPGDYNDKQIAELRAQVKKYEAREADHNRRAEEAFKAGVASQEAKVVIRTIYKTNKEEIRKLRKHVKDSLVKALFTPDATMDSSMLSDAVSTGVLDLNNDNSRLREEAKADSTSILKITEAYNEKNSALAVCDTVKAALTMQVKATTEDAETAKKKAKRRGLMNWLLGGLATAFAIIAATK